MRVLKTFLTVLFSTILVLVTLPCHAIVITSSDDTTTLLNALTSGSSGISVTNVSLDGHNVLGSYSSGTYTNVAGTYGVDSGVVLSTGDVADYGTGSNTTGLNTTAYDLIDPITDTTQQNLLYPVVGGTTDLYDVTVLTITFDLLSGYSGITFDAVFGSEEYPAFVGSPFVDGFGAYLNGTNIALTDSNPVNINNPDMAAVSGTELNGVLAPDGDPLVSYSGVSGAASTDNILTFIIADAMDQNWDSTIYLANLTGQPVPEVSTLILLGAGLFSLRACRKRFFG